MEYISALIIPIILVVVGIIFIIDKDSAEHFITGAQNGLKISVKLIPTLILLLVGIGMFTASGAVDIFCNVLFPVTERLGVPNEILPLLMLRPISGSGSLAMASQLFEKYSPDSLACLIASVIMGSSDTMLYVISVYYSSVNIKNTRHTIPAAVLTMVFCIFISCFVCRIFFA